MNNLRESISTYENFDKGILEESIKYKSLGMPIKGTCELDLIDPLTNKVKERVRTENCITSRYAGLIYLECIYNTILNGTRGSYISNYLGGSIPNAFINLLDCDTPESPDIPFLEGNLIGQANAWSTSTLGDSITGTINTSETTLVNNKKHFVFDFPTSAANGTIKSVSWSGSSNYGRIYYYKNMTTNTNFSTNIGYCEYNNKSYLLNSNKLMTVCNNSNYMDYFTLTINNIPESFYNMFSFENTMYIISCSYKIYSLNIDDIVSGGNPTCTLVGTIPSEVTSNIAGYPRVTIDNNNNIYFFIGKSVSDPNITGTYIYKYNLSNMTLITSIRLSNASGANYYIEFYNNKLYYNYNSNLYSINLDLTSKFFIFSGFPGNFLGAKMHEPNLIYVLNNARYLDCYKISPPFAYTLLPTPIVKDNAHVLKVKYDFTVDYIEPLTITI